MIKPKVLRLEEIESFHKSQQNTNPGDEIVLMEAGDLYIRSYGTGID